MRAEDVPKIRQISSQTKYHGVAMGITMGRCMGTAGRVPHNTMGWCPPHHEVWIDRILLIHRDARMILDAV